MAAPHDDTPAWIKLAQEDLARIRGRGSAKKRATIIALAKARLVGAPISGVFERPDTCTERTYYRTDLDKDGKPLGWKHDPEFQDVLESVVRVATEWREAEKLRELQEEKEHLIQTSIQLSRALFEKANEMLQFPLYEVTVPNADGGETVIQPARWTFDTLPRIAQAARDMANLGITLASDNLESDDWRLALPPGVDLREAELMVERIAGLIALTGVEAEDEEE
jgi:hypothetical protein